MTGKTIKSPLRMPGGKSKVAKLIASHFPTGITEMVSPFFGGGGVELWACQNGIKVWGYDGFLPLVRFWDELICKDLGLTGHIQSYFPLSKKDFKHLQNVYKDNYVINSSCHAMPGAVFFVLNRASFSGTTMSGGCTKTPSEGKNARFTQSSIDRLREFADFPTDMLSVNYSLWPDTLTKHPHQFMYLDPPYLIEPKIYGVRGDMHKGFDHKGLALTLRARDSPWLLSYNDCEKVREWYEGFNIKTAQWANSMGGKAKKQKELLISNY